MQSNKVNCTSRQQSIEQSIELATGDNDVARLATFAGVFLVLATIHGWLAFFWRTSPDCPANTKCGPDDTAMGFATFFTVAAEVIFTISFFASQPTQEPHTTKRSIYGVIGALLGVQAAILIWSFLTPGPPDEVGFVSISCYAFILAWLGYVLEMAFGFIAATVGWVSGQLCV